MLNIFQSINQSNQKSEYAEKIFSKCPELKKRFLFRNQINCEKQSIGSSQKATKKVFPSVKICQRFFPIDYV